MTLTGAAGEHGILSEPATLKIQRYLPGPAERVWSYLTESDLRRKWLAAGIMGAKPGAEVELVWRNDELSAQPSSRPEGFGEEHRLKCEITAYDPPKKLAITWGRSGGVTFDLEPRGERVLLTITHMRLPDRATLVMVSAGWHAHVDVLVARLNGNEPGPFWDEWSRLKQEYEIRLPA